MKKYELIGLILFVGFIIYFMTKKVITIFMIKDSFTNALNNFSPEIVANAERIFRLETAHFTTSQFKYTYSPGMEKFSNTYPYGWNTLDTLYWSKHPQYKPVGFLPFTESGTGKTKYFLKFPSLDAAVNTVCAFLQYQNNNAGRWYSKNPQSIAEYNAKINGITAKFV